MSQLQKTYQEKIIPKLQQEFGLKNPLAAPRVEKVIVNIGIGDLAHDKNKRNRAITTMTQICGQKPKIMTAKKAISEFRIRKGNIIGLKTTLRRKRMYHFLEKLFQIVLPRIRDFQGIKSSAFDGQANYTLGLSEQIVFPEVDYDIIDRVRGLEVSIVTNTNDRKKAKRLLELMGAPFEKPQDEPDKNKKTVNN